MLRLTPVFLTTQLPNNLFMVTALMLKNSGFLLWRRHMPSCICTIRCLTVVQLAKLWLTLPAWWLKSTNCKSQLSWPTHLTQVSSGAMSKSTLPLATLFHVLTSFWMMKITLNVEMALKASTTTTHTQLNAWLTVLTIPSRLVVCNWFAFVILGVQAKVNGEVPSAMMMKLGMTIKVLEKNWTTNSKMMATGGWNLMTGARTITRFT